MNNVIKLGTHRLLCGDATNKEDVTRLIGNNKVNLLLTDPPYGIDIVKTNTIGGGKPATFGNNRGTRRTSNQTIQEGQSESEPNQANNSNTHTHLIMVKS